MEKFGGGGGGGACLGHQISKGTPFAPSTLNEILLQKSKKKTIYCSLGACSGQNFLPQFLVLGVLLDERLLLPGELVARLLALLGRRGTRAVGV